MKTLPAIALLGPLLSLAISASAAPAASRPNIVLMMADDQAWGETGYNGHPHVKTPVLDEMARTALRLDRLYAGSPVCSPTRASVMTGRHPHRMGTFSPGSPIRAQELTVAKVLQSAGYAAIPWACATVADLVVGGWLIDRLIARGELQELEGEAAGQLAVRLTEVANLRGGL